MESHCSRRSRFPLHWRLPWEDHPLEEFQLLPWFHFQSDDPPEPACQRFHGSAAGCQDAADSSGRDGPEEGSGPEWPSFCRRGAPSGGTTFGRGAPSGGTSAGRGAPSGGTPSAPEGKTPSEPRARLGRGGPFVAPSPLSECFFFLCFLSFFLSLGPECWPGGSGFSSARGAPPPPPGSPDMGLWSFGRRALRPLPRIRSTLRRRRTWSLPLRAEIGANARLRAALGRRTGGFAPTDARRGDGQCARQAA